MIDVQRDELLFGDILWNKPLRRIGHLLVVGGHAQAFAGVQQVYAMAEAAGMAECRLAVPGVLRKLLGERPELLYVAATPSGSLARDSLYELQAAAQASDVLCVGPNASNNSETTITLVRLLAETRTPAVIPSESWEVLKQDIGWLQREELLLVLTDKQLYELIKQAKLAVSVPLQPRPRDYAHIAAEVSEELGCDVAVVLQEQLIVASEGDASQTILFKPLTDLNALTGILATFWIQQHGERYQSLTTAAFVAARALAKPASEWGSALRGLLAQ